MRAIASSLLLGYPPRTPRTLSSYTFCLGFFPDRRAINSSSDSGIRVGRAQCSHTYVHKSSVSPKPLAFGSAFYSDAQKVSKISDFPPSHYCCLYSTRTNRVRVDDSGGHTPKCLLPLHRYLRPNLHRGSA